jgi:colicin import membrane protein
MTTRKTPATPTAGPAATSALGALVASRLAHLERALAGHAARLEDVVLAGSASDLLAELGDAHDRLAAELEALRAAQRHDLAATAIEAREAWGAGRPPGGALEAAREHAGSTDPQTAPRIETAPAQPALGPSTSDLAAADRELAELRRRVAAFPGELAAAVQRARAEAADGARAQAAAAIRDGETARSVVEQRLADAQHLGAAQAARIAELEHELADAVTRLRDIAVKTVEGVAAMAAAPPPRPGVSRQHKA